MKPHLTILLGAGSTLNLGMVPPQVSPSGMPSTADITQRIKRMRYPEVLREGVRIHLGPGLTEPYHHDRTVSIVETISQALDRQFSYVDFESILHAVEQLEPMAEADRHDQYRAVLSAFLQLQPPFGFLSDPSVVRAARPLIVAEIYKLIRERTPLEAAKQPALQSFVHTLESKFRLAVFTLNYDDIIDGASSSWFDGFTRSVADPMYGTADQVHGFDPANFKNWPEVSDPLLVHLHGSVRFGYLRSEIGIGKYAHLHGALESVQGILEGDRYSGGQIVSASPIISGLSKSAKLVHNPEPFGYYYKAFIDSVLRCERLLIVGYGARDDHINVWLEQFLKHHGDNRRVVWICKLDGRSVGERTMEKDLIGLLAGPGNFLESQHFDNPRTDRQLHECGALRLAPSGFPITSDTEHKIIEFLFG